MVSANSMGTRSSLELMLDKLQQVNDQPSDNNIPPALPVRPVSRARLPRSTKPLQLDFRRRNDGIAQFDHLRMRGALLETSKEAAEKGISNIQKYYRGHRVRCCYEELRRGAIALQSFIRGENARSTSQCNETVCEQKSRDTAETKVAYNFVVDLQKRVLRTEAKVRGKQEENIALRIQLEELEKKMQQYEERMKSKEKAWQDQFTCIQEYLAAAACKKNEIRHHNRNSDTIAIIQQTPSVDDSELSEVVVEKICDELHPRDELRKLKLRFKEWKNEYKNKLRETCSMFKKHENSETGKNKNKWWGRLSN